jgi:BASS family bile acid:Na+ symporter
MFDWYPACEYHFAQAQLVLFTLGMGMTLAPGDFVEIARRPRSFFVGLAIQLFVIPWFAVLINEIVHFEPGISVGLILVAAMPGGALSKFFTYFGRGNMALSISLTGVSTLLTLITVPVMLQLLAAPYLRAGEFKMPLRQIVFDVAMCLLLPLIAGLGIGGLLRKQALLLSKICIRTGLILVLVMIAGSLGSGRIRPGQYGLGVPLAIICFCLLGQQTMMLPFRLCGWPRSDRMAVGIEVTMRNMNLALLLGTHLFPPPDENGGGVLFVTLFYAAAAMGAGVPLALNHRRMAKRESAETMVAHTV